MKSLSLPKYFLLGAVAASLAACGDDPKQEPQAVAPAQMTQAADQNLLAYVPADAPYVMANTKRMPREEIAAIVKKIDKIYDSIGESIKGAIEKEKLADKPEGKVMKLLADEVFTNFTLEKMESLGLRPDGFMVVYGMGLLPVLHMELSDPIKFKVFIGRLEAQAGEKLPVTQFEGKDYWRIEIEDVVISIAVNDDMLSVTLAPTRLNDNLLPFLFGKKPDNSLADTDRFTGMIERNGFLGYGAGLIDIEQITRSLLGENEGVSKEIWQALKAEQVEASAACKQEVPQLVASMPRMVFGYSQLNENIMEQKFVFELKPELAQDLKKLSMSVPGVGGTQGLLNFGFGINLLAAQQFAQSLAQERAAKPYACEWLAGFNEMGGPIAQAQLSQPLPPFITDIKGFNFVVHDLVMGPKAGGSPVPDKAMVQVAFHADNPANLYGMAAMMQPAVAQFDLKPDGQVRPLPAGVIPPVVDAPHAAMSDKAIGLSIGQGMETSLPAFMSAPAREDQPVISFSYDMALFTKLAGPAMGLAMSTMEPEQRQMMEEQMATMQNYQEVFGPLSFSVSFTDQGIQMLSGAQFR